jgi:hypothetical protein
VLSWGTILLGAAVTAFAALIGLFIVVRPRDRRRVVVGALAAGAGPLAWNAILRSAGGPGFREEAPWRAFPARWQDVATGVWSLAAVALVLGLGPDRSTSANRVLTLALGCAVAAFLVSVYLT